MEEEIIEKDMTPVLLEDLGMRYPTENSKQKKRYGIYQCQYCGKEFVVAMYQVKRGASKSCGCICPRCVKPHGLTQHPLYGTWRMMKARCYNSNTEKYIDYGGRGIQVCERWLDIKKFIEDMYPSFQEGLTLDRIDVNGDYELDNCRWTTKDIQARNTRDICINNTSGYRGVSFYKKSNKWLSYISLNNKRIHLGCFHTALEAAKAYERYVRVNNLEHNFTPALTEEEIYELELSKF